MAEHVGACFFEGQLNNLTVPSDDGVTGVKYTFYGAYRLDLDPNEDGVLDPGADLTRLDQCIDGAIADGVEPMLKIATTRGVAQVDPPTDLEAYYNFVTAVAARYLGKVHYYCIENELDANKDTWTAEAYAPLRQAARIAIRAVDAAAVVMDSGLTQFAHIQYRAKELWDATGDWTVVRDMLTRCKSRKRPQNSFVPVSEANLLAWLNGAQGVRARALVDDRIAGCAAGELDAYNIHYLADNWEVLPEIIGWSKAWQPGVPWQAWEAGYGWDDEDPDDADPFPDYSDLQHSQGLIRTLVGLLGEGAGIVIQEPYYSAASTEYDKYKRGLVDGAGRARLDAALAYETMSALLSGHLGATAVSLGAGVYAYQFSLAGGRTVWAIWSASSQAIAVSTGAVYATVTDIYGGATTQRSSEIAIGPGPVYVEAAAGGSPMTLTATITGDEETPYRTKLQWLTASGGDVTVYWGDGTETVVHPGDPAAHLYHIYPAAGTYTITIGPVEYLTGLGLMMPELSGLDTAQLTAAPMTAGFDVSLLGSHVASTVSSAHMVAWRPTSWSVSSMPAGGSYALDSAHMASWSPDSWQLTNMPAGSYAVSSAHMTAWRPTTWRLSGMPAGSYAVNLVHTAAWNPTHFNLTGLPGALSNIGAGAFAGWTNLLGFSLADDSLTQAQLNTILWSLYRSSLAGRTGSARDGIALHGSNAAPSGTYRAAPSCPVTVATPGQEIAHELQYDGCGAGFDRWWMVLINAPASTRTAHLALAGVGG